MPHSQSKNQIFARWAIAATLAVALSIAGFAAEPQVKTVPWVASDQSIPHDTFAYKSITLKGTSSLAGPQIRASWDFGDGSAPATFAVENPYDVSARHVYYGVPGTVFKATLTVTDTETGESGSATYQVAMREKSLNVEVNVAIDEGLWYLHKSMNRTRIGDQAAGYWQGAANAPSVLAFERNGHLESGDSANPYTETVSRALALLTVPDAAGRAGLSARPAQSSKAGAPARLLELALTGIGRPDARWTELETSLRDRNSLDLETSALLDFTRAMQSHAPGGVPEPLQLLESSTPGVRGLDWYAAEVSQGEVADGVARTVVNRQDPGGFWPAPGEQPTDPTLETAESILMLSATPIHTAGGGSVTNVSTQVSPTTTGYLFNRSTNTFNGTLTITNTSGSPIAGPLTVGLPNLTATVTMNNPSGTFNSAPYITLSANGLNAGEAASVLLKFNNPNRVSISFTAVTYSGTFPPGALMVTCPAATATVGTPYNSAYTGSGGVLAYTFSTPAGTLPHNLTLNTTTGAVTGTPDTVQNPTFTAQVTDSAGGTPQTASDATCHINVTSANQAPTAVAQSPSTNEDTAKLITLSGTDPDGNALTFSIVTPPSNGMLGMIGAPSCAGNPSTCTASVTYTPTANTSGPDSFTFKVNDGMADSSPATVSITVTFVNDVPSFTKGADQVTTNNAGAVTVPGWATAISPGPGSNESGQIVHFNITGNTNAGLFSVGPAVDATGQLTFTPQATSTGGIATITLNIQDDGGTLNGGVDTSAPQMFTITVNAAPAITSANNTTFAPGKTGQTFSVTTTGFPTNGSMSISASGGTGFPSAVSLSNNGNGTATISGTPAAHTQDASPYTVTITASNGISPDAMQSFTLNIVCPAITVSGTIPGLTFNTAMATATFTQSGGNGTIVFSATGLPTGVGINSSTGDVTGTPSVTGTFSASIIATDAGACTGSKAVTVAVKPVAVNDSYSGLVDNTQFVVTGGTTMSPLTPFVGTNGMATFRLTNNDLPSGGVTLTSTGTFATTMGGSVTIAADGTFIYTPKANPTLSAITSDTFTYTISSDTGATGTPTTAMGTATLTLANRVWYVKNNGSAGNGQSQSSFQSLSAAIAASTTNDFIFVYQGDGTTANMTTASALKTGQSLIGQGVSLVVNGSTLVAAGSTPLIGGTVTLETNTTARGFNLSTGASTGMTGSSISGVTVNTVAVTTMAGTGVSLSNITSSALSFTGLTTNGGTGATLTGTNTGATFTFTGVSVSSGANTGINSTGGGTLTITGAANTLTSTTGTALNVANTTIGASGLTFLSISANGAANGIVLNNTGSNGLTVTGTGTTNGSGGTIQNITNRGASFITANAISLSNMNFTNVGTTNGADPTVGTSTCGDHVTGTNTGCNAGINLQTVTGVTLTNVQMNGGKQEGINGNNVTNFVLANSSVLNFGDQVREHGLNFINILGTSAITNTTITGNQADQIRIDNNTGTLTKLDLKDSTIGTSSAPNGEHGIAFNMHGATAQMRLQVQGVHFSNVFSNCIDSGSDGTRTAGTGGLVVVIDGTATAATNKNQFTGCGASAINVVQDSSSDVSFNIHDNGTLASPTFLGGTSSHVININQAANAPVSAVLQGAVTNNVIGNASSTTSATVGGEAVSVNTVAPGTLTILISGNNTQGTGTNGILVSMGEDTNAAHKLNATILNNTAKVSDVNSFDAFHIAAGTLTGDVGTMCAEINGNTGNSSAGNDFNVRQRFLTTFQLRGYTGTNTDANNPGAVQTHLDVNQNNTATHNSWFITSNVSGGGGGFVNSPGPGNQCTQPTVPTLQ